VTDKSQIQFPVGLLSRNIDQLSLASLWCSQIEYLLCLRVKDGILTSAGWQVTLCDPI